ncbi:CopM family metallochaperone [Ramlibacter tataouinensis]|uniref:Candidate membrane protein n=1 Tax=Ramlibacter tataouinensis (strain ATCC BAA-407 / DSM 14655 / LMG 21543 / TTB310) TaxID=365046 RepID=F5Y379_RAMTT|nr:DUF305 domain-containing protein [Ramlibacter tataouinensis]AEG91166.1 candidate membrane protein [Ramlibacter tataouinensis TTB310]
MEHARSCGPRAAIRAATAAGMAAPLAASAHVKWFAPYIIEAPPQRLMETLTDRWFWTGILLVLVFFLAARALEKTRAGGAVLAGFDKVTGPLWARGDDFMRFVIAAFFVAIFAVGGVYLTPDLKSPHEWVSWMQLLIAALVFSRRTMPLAAAGIIGLWLLALTQYELFHLLDYLALGVGVAAYLVLAASDRLDWNRYRFVVLRWGVAIALMWSSLEKFAYPDWFYPLVEEKPFLTFGMPRDVFIPMAGVAEFTMGFGLLWTALIRRLSALALFVIFNAAVYPFGRLDLVGHALIMAVIVIIFADPTPQVRFALRRTLAAIPATLVATMAVSAMSYWGLHHALYGLDGRSGVAANNNNPGAAARSTHTHDPERPHEAPAAGGSAQAAYLASMQRMHGDMEAGVKHPDPDQAFVRGMIAHHRAAIEMAQIQLRHGTETQNRRLAQEIIETQKREIAEMEAWLRQRHAGEDKPG